MSRGRWGIIAALAGLALVGASPAPKGSAQSEQAQRQQAVGKQVAPTDTATPKEPIPAPPDAGCERGDDKRSSDLCAQWKAADSAYDAARWGWWQLIIGSVGLVLGAVTMVAAIAAAVFAKRAAVATESTVEVARETAEGAGEALGIAERNAEAAIMAAQASHRAAEIGAETLRHAQDTANLDLRPWLSVFVRIASPATYDQHGFKFSVLITVKNVGKSVARQVWITPEAVPLPSAEVAEKFFVARRAIDIRQGLNNLLNPGEEVSGTHFVMVTPEALERVAPKGTISPGLIVSVVYQSVRSDDILQTGRTYSLSEISSGVAKVFPSVIGSTVPPQHIGLHPYPLGGDYAT